MSNPAVQTNASLEALVGQVAGEFADRLNRGEKPSVQEYVEKHPEIAELLPQVLQAQGLMRQPGVEAALADDDPNLAEPLGDFRLLREIGHGGMGVVYEAKQLSLNRTVAVKVLPFAAALDTRKLQRFKNEALAAASLHHEHIVPVYFVGCERGVHFYAMQYIEGLSLAAIIAELRQQAGRAPADPERTVPTFSPAGAGTDTWPLAAMTTEGSMRLPGYFDNVARLGLEAAKGLEHAHQEVVWHRDIKPANLLVDTSGSLWIADFGLAQMRSDPHLTFTGELVGTLRYMSPEQVLAKRVPVDQRTDVYSLGATLYELLTLEPVFSSNDSQELIQQIMFDDPRPPRRLNPHVPRDLETIVLTALAKAPAHRYASAKEMAEDLHRFLNDQPIKARPEGLPRWLWRESRRHASMIALGLAAVITSVVLLLFFLHLNKLSPEEEEDQRQQKALAALKHDLDLKKKVTLIGESGRPGYFRLKTDTTVARFVDARDGVFQVQDWDTGLVELLPDPRLERYRFSAEVRHDRRTTQESRVGIYFAHSQQGDGDTVAHFHCNLAFNDWGSVGLKRANGGPQRNAVELQIHRQPATGPPDKAYVPEARTLFDPSQSVKASGVWRKIAVEMRPETIKLLWEGDCFATIPRAKLPIIARQLIARPEQLTLPPNSPQYAPRGGLGLFVSLGVASFRNVTVEPIGDEN